MLQKGKILEYIECPQAYGQSRTGCKIQSPTVGRRGRRAGGGGGRHAETFEMSVIERGGGRRAGRAAFVHKIALFRPPDEGYLSALPHGESRLCEAIRHDTVTHGFAVLVP
ncbi:hypothetical protein EVAR_23998_1 [Eumeta japonica]|uniref:Uncharacterized protein n=1 Tax=Eumeta variegata TaxID=151549 RepID=A0A4C1W8Q9_EUMVA|nr:hypothetical protein EVAR_23998_1 [Eumeta japonica]